MRPLDGETSAERKHGRAFFTCGSLVVSTRNATYRSRAGAIRGSEIPLDGGSRVLDPQIYGCNVFNLTSDRVHSSWVSKYNEATTCRSKPDSDETNCQTQEAPSFSPQLYPLEQVGGEIELPDADLPCRSSSEQKFGCTASKARPGV